MTSPNARCWKGHRVRCADRRSSSLTCSRTPCHCRWRRPSHSRTPSAVPGHSTFSRENVLWPGTADGVREWLGRLQRQWQGVLEQVSDDDLRSAQRTRWPFQHRAFGDVIAWVNVELTKNAAEVGYARFLYAVRRRSQKRLKRRSR